MSGSSGASIRQNGGAGALPSDKQRFDEIIASAERIISDDHERLEVPDDLVDNVILLDNGVLMVTETALASESLSGFVRRLERSPDVEITKKLKASETDLNYVRSMLSEDLDESEDTGIEAMATVESEKLFYSMLKIAAEHRSSDIHYFVYGKTVSALMRLNGRLKRMDVKKLTPKRAKEFMAAAYGMTDSKGDFNPNRHQEGNVRIDKVKDPILRKGLSNYVSTRLNFLPVAGRGIKMVARLNGKHEDITSFEDVGFSAAQNELLMRVSNSPGGFFVIGGPVNSGKSRTLACIVQIRRDINTNSQGMRETSQLSLEDPPELFVDGLLPLDIMAEEEGEEASDKKLHEVMRGLNRSDYDDGYPGEVRDGVMAQRVVEVAMAGRFTGSTVHAPNAMMVFTRLEQLLQKIRGSQASFDDLYEQANCAGVMSQRLLPRLCRHCSTPLQSAVEQPQFHELFMRISKMMPISHPSIDIRLRGKGCDHCQDGHIGRELVAEIIRPDQKFLEHLKAKQVSTAREYWIKSLNGSPMVEQAVDKMRKGLVDPQEVERTFGYFDEITVNVQALENDDSVEDGI